MSPVPAARAAATWPIVSAPSSSKAAASAAPPMPTESMTRRMARAMSATFRFDGLVDQPPLLWRLADAVGEVDRIGGRVRRILVGSMHPAKGSVSTDIRTDPGELRQPHGMVDRVARSGAATAKRYDDHAERTRIDPSHGAGLLRMHVADHGRFAQISARAFHK